MKNTKLLLLTTIAFSSLSFAQSEEVETSWLKRARQKACGKYLITHAREAGCEKLERLLQDLRKYNVEEFATKSKFSLNDLNSVQDLLVSTITLKHSGPMCEFGFSNKLQAFEIKSEIYNLMALHRQHQQNQAHTKKDLPSLLGTLLGRLIFTYATFDEAKEGKLHQIKEKINESTLKELLGQLEKKLTHKTQNTN